MNAFRTLIIPTSIAQLCRNLAATWAGGVGMFTTELYTGSNLTHYISTGYIDSEVAAMMDDPDAFAAATGIPAAEADTLRSEIHISERRDVHAELAELGLSLEVSG